MRTIERIETMLADAEGKISNADVGNLPEFSRDLMDAGVILGKIRELATAKLTPGILTRGIESIISEQERIIIDKIVRAMEG